MNSFISKKNQAFQRDLEKTVRELNTKGNINADIKISVYDIKDGTSANVDGDKIGWAASIIKLPVMVEVGRQIENKKFKLESEIEVDHSLILEEFDSISMLPEGFPVSVGALIHRMMVYSDNTATNMLARKVGIGNINETMWELGMKKSMLGHLLCPKVPRYTSKFNPDGSNVTCPNDMTRLMRHIYDPKFSLMSPFNQILSDVILSATHASYMRKYPFVKSDIKAKLGAISDPIAGRDIHEVGIIDNHLIVSIMLNKIDPNPSLGYFLNTSKNKFDSGLTRARLGSYSNTSEAYSNLMKTVGRYTSR